MTDASPIDVSKSAYTIPLRDDLEWLEADGLGGFSMGTVLGPRTRRYHGLLLVATTPPTGRMMLVNGLEAWIESPAGHFSLTSQRYTPDVVAGDGSHRLQSFRSEPWPIWTWRLEDGSQVELALFVPHRRSACVLNWTFSAPRVGSRLCVRPLLSGRDYHSLQRENPVFRFDGIQNGDVVAWEPYPGVPGVRAIANAAYRFEPEWYRDFLYTRERERGLDCIEDLASPGVLTWDCSEQGALIFAVESEGERLAADGGNALEIAARLQRSERARRAGFLTRLDRSADAYFVKRDTGTTIIAGYPWFTDWGRDTFIALPGLCLATGRFEEARQILLTWGETVSDGMLPNRFGDSGGGPEYNSVDASLWYVLAVDSYLAALSHSGLPVPFQDVKRLTDAVGAILSGYSRGTRFGIRADDDGLLAAGVPGMQLTWMDVKIGNWVMTPRVGKPVEVEALWLNALLVGARFDGQWQKLYQKGLASFRARFWNASRGILYDVVDVDHKRGTADATFRPNQIFAAGGLPQMILEPERARRVVDAVETNLWTPCGLRTLEPSVPAYRGRYEGGVAERDSAYHQGTVWPWLAGPFIEAWVKVRGQTPEAKREAMSRFVRPLVEKLGAAGLEHLPELADGDPPHSPRGCPFQAWSLAALIRTVRQTVV